MRNHQLNILQQKKEEKDCKHFHINDNMNLLSRNQKAKIKSWLKENDFEEDDMGSSGWKPDKLALKYYSER